METERVRAKKEQGGKWYEFSRRRMSTKGGEHPIIFMTFMFVCTLRRLPSVLFPPLLSIETLLPANGIYLIQN